ncbi:ABC transporter permease [Desulforhopalus sp. IMCC35007]|uniref:ABC transporter permease n=1 Tax=Desulforhopalus sp. IMCC35007 TaxID=2569543 RepID=UPI0010ADEF33|nr:ABC transporter permease [Desulforhopalus sp. IMCC35007]TKB09383.1 ABC transporter permease [Desulforhopalus sp. IMCC35007]
MKKIAVLALNTFRESIRDKIFYSLLAFAVLMLGFSLILGNLTIGDEIKIIKDFGLAAISLFGVLIAIFVGISLVYKEMEKRTIYVILANPISRYQFVLGKYLGLSFTLMVEVVVMTAGLFVLCYLKQQLIPWELFMAIVPICFELQLILAVALLFSTFVSPFLSGMLTLAVFIIGHLTLDFKVLVASLDNPALKKTADVLYYSFPNLETLNFKARVVHGIDIPWTEFIFSLSYAATYTIMILALSLYIFNKRDIR